MPTLNLLLNSILVFNKTLLPCLFNSIKKAGTLTDPAFKNFN